MGWQRTMKETTVVVSKISGMKISGIMQWWWGRLRVKSCAKRLAASAFLAVSASFSLSAAEWYVDSVNGKDTYDGKASKVASEATGPRRTLAGIMSVAGANDTVWLLPGTYDDGTMYDSSDTYRRLQVSGKAGMKFRSTGGRDVTFIDGDGTCGCVRIINSDNCRFEGITFRNGVAPIGAGLRDHTGNCWVIGCRFENCTAGNLAGAMLQGCASGTEFVDCTASGSAAPDVAYNIYAEFCGFRNQKTMAHTAFANGGTFVNCTIVGCRAGVFNASKFRLYNTLVFGNESANGAGDNGATHDGCLFLTNSFIGKCSSSFATVGTGSEKGMDAARIRMVAGAAGDFRLADTSEVRAAGNAAWLNLKTFPEGFTRKDIYGSPVTATSGTIAVGCSVVDFPKQTFGCIGVNSCMAVREFGETVFCSNDSFTPIGENWVFMLRPIVADGTVPHYVSDTKNREPSKQNYFALPGSERWFPVPAMPELGSNRMFSTYNATQLVYVDATNGSDSYDGSSSNIVSGTVGPKKTLSAAVAAVGAGRRAVIFALPGVYDDGTDGEYANKAGNPDASLNGIRYRLHVKTTASGDYKTSIGVVAVAGPEKTFIVGEPDPDTGDVGSKAIGGVWLESGIHYVQGFTITGCYGPGVSGSWWQHGAAFNGGGSESTHLMDCTVSNNVAIQTAATGYGTVLRCRILDNLSGRYTGENSQFGSCIFAGNQRTNETDTADQRAMLRGNGVLGLYGCTVDDANDANGFSPIYNGNTAANLALRHTGTLDGGYVIDNVPCVADASGRDYRLWSLSSAIGATAVSGLSRHAYFDFLTDIDGNALEISDGMITVGAMHDAASRVASYAVVGQGGEISGGATTNAVVSADAVTATASLSRPFLHFDVNGEVSGRTSVTFTPSAEAGAATVVIAVFGTNWYVNASAGSDAASGASEDRARATIRSCTTNAWPGDVIHVAAGTYGAAEGSETASGEALPSRVVIPAGVTLEGTDGADATFIVGEASPDCDSTYGNGPDSVRCVRCGNGAVLRGFTLTGGHTLQELKISGMTKDQRGGAIFSDGADSRYEDCIISNNASFLATIYSGKVVRCGVYGNSASKPYESSSGNPFSTGPAGENCSWYGCVIDGNCGNATMYNPVRIEFCTVGDGNFCYDRDGRRYAQVVYRDANAVCRMFNTVILGSANTTYGTTLYATNCLFRTSINTIGWTSEPYASNRGGCIMTNVENIAVDGAFTPIYGLYAGLDRGDVSLCDGTLPIDKDINGVQRIYNGMIDIGAAEYDWRGRFTKALGSGVSVSAAAPDATEEGTGVKLPGGEISGTLRKGNFDAVFSVVGDGTLYVYCNGSLVGEYAEAVSGQKLRMPLPESGASFSFLFEPDETNPGGYALLASVQSIAGTVIVVR